MAESEQRCSYPLNLLVSTSVGMVAFLMEKSNASGGTHQKASPLALLFLLWIFLLFVTKGGEDEMSSNRTLFIIEVAIFTALAMLLDILPFLKFKVWPNGGSISFAMIPVFIVAFRWGIKGGLSSGLLWGILQLAFGAYVLTPLQGFIEYGFAFTVLGLAGVFSKPLHRALKEKKYTLGLVYIMSGIFLGTLLRFIAHFYAGIVFWGEATPEGTAVWYYSLTYNATYMFPSFVLCSAVVFFLFRTQPRALLKTVS